MAANGKQSSTLAPLLMSTHLNFVCSLTRQQLRPEDVWTPPHSQAHWELTRTKSTPVLRILPPPTLQYYRVKETLFSYPPPQTTLASQARRWFLEMLEAHICYLDDVYFPKHSPTLRYLFYLARTL